jgi:hypothetical protein
MERRDQELPSESSQMATEEWNYTPAQIQVLRAVAQQLVPEADTGESGQREIINKEFALSLVRLASQLCPRQATVAPSHESGIQPRRLPAPSEDAQASAEPSKGQATEKSKPESGHGISSGESAEAEVVVGSLRAAQEDGWVCKVPSCTGSFHRLKDCKVFHGMEPEDRVKLVERHKLCLGCLTPGHSRTARSCPFKEELADGCQRTSCKARHHHLLHLEKRRMRPKGRAALILLDPTPTEEPGHAVQLVAQWVSTKGGAPSLVFGTRAPR